MKNRNIVAGDEWISIKDRVPETDTDVLCVYVYKNKNGLSSIGTGRYVKSNNKWSIMYMPKKISFYIYITHWQPLPEPPKDVM